MDVAFNQVSVQREGRTVLDRVTFQLKQGNLLAIVGPNGAGKSTLLQLLSGTLSPSRGEGQASIKVGGQSIATYRRQEIARRIAVLPQGGFGVTPMLASFTVREVVAMGRYPYQNWLGYERNSPAKLIDETLQWLDLAKVATRSIAQLSGGERQRVALAKVMVQQPELLLLDEPTTFLDIGHQVKLLDTIKRWQNQQNLTVVVVLHDLNLAAQYADELIALYDGRIVAQGAPSDVLTAELVHCLYEAQSVIIPHPLNDKPQLIVIPNYEEEPSCST